MLIYIQIYKQGDTKMQEETLKDINTTNLLQQHVMALLRRRKLKPEDVSEEVLSLQDESGISVLDICIKRFREPVADGNGRTVPRAFFLVCKPDCGLPLHFRKVKEILQIAREDGWSVAHEAAYQGSLPESMMTEDILKLTTRVGCSVAYHVARRKNLPEWAKRQKDILLLSNGYGDYVAHMLAKHGDLPTEMMTEDILTMTDSSKCAIAYYSAWHDSFPEWATRRKDILLLGDGQGNYVAHVLARCGKLPLEMMTEDILKLKNEFKRTVLFAIVSEKHLSLEILLLPWKKKTRVFEYLQSKQFQKQIKNKEDVMIYVEKQLATLGTLIQEKFISGLLQQHYDYDGIER